MKAFSYSQALLALSIMFLAFAILRIAIEVPKVLESFEKAIITVDKAVVTVDKTSALVDKITPEIPLVIAEADKIRAEVALVRLMLDRQIPQILAQIESSKPLIDAAIKESEQYSTQIPSILKQVELVQHDINQFYKLLPQLLKRIDNIVLMANSSQAELEKWRPISQDYLLQIQQSQDDIPRYLLRVENIIVDAKTIGSEATSGLVGGFLRGVVTLPFKMVSDVSGVINEDTVSAKYLSAGDLEIMKKEIGLLLNSSSNKAVWNNTQSGNRGTILKSNQENRGKKVCYKITMHNAFKNKKETLNELMCKNEAGQWEVR